ncbi:MAG: hypothetical protein ACJAXA_002278 [Candidatus Aldehydirespiratoraceae bacterium]|jgi:hypothetical protein
MLSLSYLVALRVLVGRRRVAVGGHSGSGGAVGRSSQRLTVVERCSSGDSVT